VSGQRGGGAVLLLVVNGCSRCVSLSLSRHQGFLKSKEAERRLQQLKEQLERGGPRVPPEERSELSAWLAEQQEEVQTFTAQCLNRQSQMQPLLRDLDR